MAIKIDDIDRDILTILQKNAKITNSKLAKEVGLSPAPTLERVKKLENLGVIKSYHAELDQDLMGVGVCVFIQASLQGSDKEMMESFKKKIQTIPEVIECYHITGSADFMLKVLSKNMKSYNDFILDQLIELKEIGNLQSMVVLSTVKNSKQIQLK